MRFLPLFLLLGMTGIHASAQQPSPAAPPIVSSTEAHHSAAELVDVTGARQRLLDHVDDTVQAGMDAMKRESSNYAPEFIAEWGRRMRARFNVDDYLAVMVRVYEAHFNNDELRQLINFQKDTSAGKPANLSPELKQKVTTQMNDIQSEIVGGCSQVGARVGGEVGQEIAKEHPEWLPKSPAGPPAH